MAVPRLSLLHESDLERIHEDTLRVLSEVGVRFESPTARAVLREAGALGDEDTGIMRIPPDTVEWALEQAPKRIVLGARDGSSHCVLDHSRTWVTLGGVAPGTLDFRTGERRQATVQDLADAMLVADALPEIDFLWPIVMATDEAPKLQALRSIATMFASSGKHVQGEVLDPRDVPYALEIARRASADGRLDLKQPVFSNLYCPVSPLQHEEGPLEAAILLARAGVPQTIYPLALAGATAPVTLAGTLVQVNAEVLSTVTVLELASPGCPLIYVGNGAIMDMQAGRFAQAGPETVLLNAGLVEIGLHYGLPVFTAGFYTDDWNLTMHAGVDDAQIALGAFLGRPDVVSGPGLMGSAMVLHLPKIVIDAEICRMCTRVMQGIVVDEEHVMYDLIARVGPGGHYLKAKETRRYRTAEHLSPKVFVRETAPETSAPGAADLERARQRVEQILAEHEPLPLPDPEAVEAVIASADRELQSA
jgi:trimethylamine---corrinoid protein Co-methyltransferase